MKQTEGNDLAWGIAIVVVVLAYPFYWLYQKVGGIGLALIVAAVVVAFFYWALKSGDKDEAEFNELALHTLYNRIPPDEAKKTNIALAKDDFNRAALIRRLQILRDSIDISISSKKRSTAESRMEEVRQSYNEIKNEYASLVSQETMTEIDNVVKEHEENFSTQFFINIAQSNVDKAESLKTIKSKNKYLNLAKEAIQEGLDTPSSDKHKLSLFQKEIEAANNNLESSS